MSKQVLTIEQIQHLQELGIEASKASMYRLTFNGDMTSVLHYGHCYGMLSLHPFRCSPCRIF